MPFINDTFTDTSGTDLASHTPDTGTGWTKREDTGIWEIDSTGGRVQNTGVAYALYTEDTTPPSADYEVQADYIQVTAGETKGVFICGRYRTSDGANYHILYWDPDNEFRLKVDDGTTASDLGIYTENIDDGTPRTVKLVMNGDQISAVVDGITRIGPITDATVTAAGLAGLGGDHSEIALDDFSATDLASAASVSKKIVAIVGT